MIVIKIVVQLRNVTNSIYEGTLVKDIVVLLRNVGKIVFLLRKVGRFV